MAPDFNPAIAIELAYEGGLSNHPKDPGGLTNRGITIPAYTDYLKRPATAADIVAITPAIASAVYHATYWPAVRGDDLPSGIDLTLLDEAINAGRGRAVQHLQQALRLNVIDRVFGAATLAATRAADPVALIEAIRLERVSFYRSLPAFATFGTGWLRRVNGIALTSSTWARRT